MRSRRKKRPSPFHSVRPSTGIVKSQFASDERSHTEGHENPQLRRILESERGSVSDPHGSARAGYIFRSRAGSVSDPSSHSLENWLRLKYASGAVRTAKEI